MKIDREGFRTAVQQDVISDEALVAMWKNGDVDAAEAEEAPNVRAAAKSERLQTRVRRERRGDMCFGSFRDPMLKTQCYLIE